MASTSRYGYRKLRDVGGWFQEDSSGEINLREKVIGRRKRSFIRFRRSHFRGRLKLRIPSLRRLLRKKARLLRAAWVKMVKRFKENQGLLGDLFAGNYLFMQVNPTPLKTIAQIKSIGQDLYCRPITDGRLVSKFAWCVQFLSVCCCDKEDAKEAQKRWWIFGSFHSQ